MLRWIEIGGQHFDGDEGFAQLILADITILWGKNDAGKSTTLRAVDDILALRTAGRSAADIDSNVSYRRAAVAMTPEQAEQLAEKAWGDCKDLRGIAEYAVGEQQVAIELDRLYDDVGQRLAGSVLQPWIEFFTEPVDPRRREDIRRAALSEPTLLLTSPDDDTWCAWFAVPGSTAKSRMAWVPVAPAAAERVRDELLPISVRAPIAWPHLRALLADAASEMGAAMATYPDYWIQADLPDAALRTRILHLLGSLLRTRLPGFVTDRYDIQLSTAGEEVAVAAVRHGTVDPFPVERLAQGLHLWVQLALSDVGQFGRRLARGFQTVLAKHPANEVLGGLAHAIVDGLPGPEIAELAQRFDAVWDTPRGLDADDDDDSPFSVLQLVRGHQNRLYVIDEPERHLHPALQREAAEWLRSFAARPGNQLVLATHAPSFLRGSFSTSLVRVARTEDFRIVLESADARAVAMLDRQFGELGFDRGEALALYRAILFVEGQNDRDVLEILCRERLRDHGILVQPLRGAKNVERLLEAETLLRFMGPPFHVLVDNVDVGRLEAVRGMSADELASLLSDKRAAREAGYIDELLWLARLRLTALHEMREVGIHAISAKDILGLLDDDCVREVIRERGHRGRTYEGFAALIEEHGDSYSRHLEEYGITKSGTFFADVARLMRSRGLNSPELDGVVDAIWMSTAGLA